MNRVNNKNFYCQLDTDPLYRFAKTILYTDHFMDPNNWTKDWSFATIQVACYKIQNYAVYLKEPIKIENFCGEAFSFYEVINSIDIIYHCAQFLYKSIGHNKDDFLKNDPVFIKSNRDLKNDCKFFEFIRSACCAHPLNTTRHKEFTGEEKEEFLYLHWDEYDPDFLRNPKAKLESYTKDDDFSTRVLYLEEFYDFAQKIINSFKQVTEEIESKYE